MIWVCFFSTIIGVSMIAYGSIKSNERNLREHNRKMAEIYRKHNGR